MFTKNFLARSKLLPILLVLISAFFLLAFQSPVHAAENRADRIELADATSHEIHPDPDETAPAPDPQVEASIKADPLNGYAPLTVEFGVVFDNQFENDNISIRWNFDTGDTDMGERTNYTFKEPGEYLVTLVISDGRAEYFADSVLITVYPTIRYCRVDCLIAEKIQLEINEIGDTTFVSGEVLVRNENEHPIPDAEVKLIWSRPDGREIIETVVTDRTGIAHSAIQANYFGLYVLRVDDIRLDGFQFDRFHSLTQAGIRR